MQSQRQNDDLQFHKLPDRIQNAMEGQEELSMFKMENIYFKKGCGAGPIKIKIKWSSKDTPTDVSQLIFSIKDYFDLKVKFLEGEKHDMYFSTTSFSVYCKPYDRKGNNYNITTYNNDQRIDSEKITIYGEFVTAHMEKREPVIAF